MAGGHHVAAVWRLDVGETSAPADLSTLVELRINGLPVACPTSSAGDPSSRSRDSGLEPNRPNPFSAQTSIAFELERSGAVRVEVFDPAGRHLRTLLDRPMAAGKWSVSWDGRTAIGEAAASGVYFCRLVTAQGTETRTMTLRR